MFASVRAALCLEAIGQARFAKRTEDHPMSEDAARTPIPPAPLKPKSGPVRSAMNAVAELFGVTPDDRTERIATMLASRRGSTSGYWLQLLLAMAIATLGLHLGSTAVVIGAMLVSPLMTPILALGMGLAVGSPLLVIRSAVRVVASVTVVVLIAALLTLALPINEVTDEISSRTSPTALDLAVASCCAVAGVYAIIRPGSDTASAAAGTAIGIALVPPLCVVGYGLGTSTSAIASGAALLFTANFCAILLFSVLGFVLLGYGNVAIAELEREHAAASPPGGVTARVARRMSIFFASKLGPAVRIAMPVVFVVAVYWPLRTALGEVTWEIRVRSAARDALRSLPEPSVYSSVRIERRQVSVRVVTVGDEAAAARLRKLLTERITPVAGVEPSVEVVAVPDAKSLAREEAARRGQPHAVAPASVAHADLTLVRRDAKTALEAWPVNAAGPLLAWRLSFAGSDGAGTVEVVHIGRPLGAAGESLLAHSLSDALHEQLRVRDLAFDAEPIAADRADGLTWLARAGDAVSRMRALPDDAPLFACIDTPTGRDVESVVNAVHEAAVFQHPRVVFGTGDAWRLHWSTTTCNTTRDAGPGDAGEADARPRDR
jgi:uncharacterized hydrophobic protein (TIGR00271 family)